MKRSAWRLIVAVALATIAVVALPPQPTTWAESKLTFSLDHYVTIDEYGFLLVTDTLRITNPTSSAVTLGPLAIEYALPRAAHMTAPSTAGTIRVRATVESLINASKIFLQPTDGGSVPANSSVAIKVSFYLFEALERVSTAKYGLTLTLMPGFSEALSHANSTVTLPSQAKLAEELMGFEKSAVAGSETWRARYSNLASGTRTAVRVILDATAAPDFTPLEFQRIERVLSVAPSGTVSVRESIVLFNLGDNELSKLKLSLLDEGLKRVAIVPLDDPPLVNRLEIPIEGDSIDLRRDLKVVVAKSQTFTLRLEYPLPSKYVTVEGESVKLTVPLTPPIRGVAKQFRMAIDLASGYKLISGSTLEVRRNSSSLDDDQLSVIYRLGAAWAATEAIPVATATLVAAFASLSLSELLGKREVVKEAAAKIADFVRIFEEKLGSTDEILTSVKDSRLGEVSRRKLDEARRSLESIMARASSRLGELRSDLLSRKPELQRLLNELVSVDKEYDRSAKELYRTLEQYHTQRIKRETFERLLPGYEKRLARHRDALMDLLNSLLREF